MAPRPTWQGHLRLSLVTCPVSLFPATSAASDVRFHLINPATGNRVRTEVFDAEGGRVERRDLVRGYEIEKDRYILLTDEEIRSVRLESTRTIDIERFVDLEAIDRIWWNDPYYMAPEGKAGLDAFTVIRAAMEDANKLALARVVIGTRERLVAIEPRGTGMLVTTLRSHDEVRDSAELFAAIPDRKADAGMIEIARRIIDQQAGAFDPSAFRDRYEDALRDLIHSKESGDGGVRAAQPRTDNVIDLMEALRRSLEGDGGGATPTRKAAAKGAATQGARSPQPKATATAKPKPTTAAKPAASRSKRAPAR